VYQVAADHQTGAALPRLAVYGHHISVVFAHVGVYILAELIDHIEVGGLMIIESVLLAGLIKRFRCIATLTAQIVHFIEACMIPAEEFLDIAHGVPVEGLHALTGETHGDDPGGDIGEVEVEAVLHVSPLIA